MNKVLSGNRISVGGWLGFITAVMIILSTSVDYRLSIGPLYVHAYLLVIPVFWLVMHIDLSVMTREVWIYLLLFTTFFSLACLFDIADVPHMIKVVSAAVTFVFFAQTIRMDRDFRLVGLGFTLCAVFLGIKGMLISDQFSASKISTGVVALEGIGNKNAQSLYMLPGLFFSGLAIMRAGRLRKYRILALNLLLLSCIIFGLILSANRSGWVVGLIALAFIFGNSGLKMRSFVYLIILGFGVTYFVEEYASDIVEYKYDQTFVRDYKSDDARKLLLIESMKAGLDQPFLGLGPMDLTEHLAIRAGSMGFQGDVLDPHNLFGYLLGGTGFFSFTFFFLFLYALTKDSSLGKRVQSVARVREVKRMLWFFLVIFLIRGLFTREILYSPTFIGSMGVFYAYYQLTKANYIKWYAGQRLFRLRLKQQEDEQLPQSANFS